MKKKHPVYWFVLTTVISCKITWKYFNPAGPKPSSYFEHKKLSGKKVKPLSQYNHYQIVFQGYPFGRFDWQMGNQRILRQVKGKLVNFIQDRRRVCAARSPHLLPTLSSPSLSPLVLKRRSPATGALSSGCKHPQPSQWCMHPHCQQNFQVVLKIVNLLSVAWIPLANKPFKCL